jgi:hypothetical protein
LTEDGHFIALARFGPKRRPDATATAPNRTSSGPRPPICSPERPPSKTATTSPSTGDPDDAGFVQVIQGRGSDPDRARELMGQDSSEWAAFRPDILGSLAVGHEGGAYTMAVYLTSEAAAREGERKEPPPELQAQMEEMVALSVGEP